MDALNKFEGGIAIVTHNVSLISKVCNEIWECGHDKTVEPFQGDFEDYAARLVKELKDAEVRRRGGPARGERHGRTRNRLTGPRPRARGRCEGGGAGRCDVPVAQAL